MNVWKMITHHTNRDSAIAWTRKNGRIAIGWGRVGDITNFDSKAEVKDTIHEHYPIPPYSNNAHWGAPSIWDFCYEMKKGDLVILAGRSPRELVVKILGDYEYVAGESPLEGDYQNQRRVQVTEIDANKLWFAAGKAPGKPIYQSLIKCAHSVNLSEI